MMKMAALLPLLLLAGSPAQEAPGKKSPRPCCDGRNPHPWADYNKGVQWSQPAGATVDKARRDNRLIMFFQLVGDLDKEGC